MYNACSVEKMENLCRWIAERREGEFIEDPKNGWRKQCLSFDEISQHQIDSLCQIARGFLLRPEEFISNSCGEIFLTIKAQLL